jgi:Cap4 dsDNA endonuclease
MSDSECEPSKVTPQRQSPTLPNQSASPSETRNTTDPGDATGRNFRYQHAYGVMLMAAARRGLRPYLAIWCEHHEDFLAERHDGLFNGYQIKTSRPERGAWRLTDGELTKSIGRFIDLVSEFGDKIGDLFFVSNTEFDEITPASSDEKRRGRCPRLFLNHVRNCAGRESVEAPFCAAFDELQATCGCDADQLLTVLKRMDLILGPSRNEFDATLSHEHRAGSENLNRGISGVSA